MSWLEAVLLSLVTAVIGFVIGLLTRHYDYKHQMRLAALDRRLQAHQEAYVRLWRIAQVIRDDQKETEDRVVEAQEWWVNNCLYLSDEGREAFNGALIAAWQHHDFMQMARENPGDIGLKQDERKNWQEFQAAGPAILRGVALPPVGQDPLPFAKLRAK